MRPQGVLRSLRLLQRAYARPYLEAIPGPALRRGFQTVNSHPRVPDFAFAFEYASPAAFFFSILCCFVSNRWSSIDGVLLRASKPIPGAAEALYLLEDQGIPFILLTNGGGKHETERVEEISKKLDVKLDPTVIIQSHSPFAEFVKGTEEQSALEDKCVLVVGGEGDNCRQVAYRYCIYGSSQFDYGFPV